MGNKLESDEKGRTGKGRRGQGRAGQDRRRMIKKEWEEGRRKGKEREKKRIMQNRSG